MTILDLRDVQELFCHSCLRVDEVAPQALSDIVRLRLLQGRGGVWVDASLFPVKPLAEWLPHALSEAGFFAFERPGPDRPISSWFLASVPGNLIVREWSREVERFWSGPRRLISGIPDDPVASVSPEGVTDEYPYFWLHYLFQYLLDTRPQFAGAWRRCVKISADPAHRLQTLFLHDPRPQRADIEKAANCAPVQKLDWRASYPLDVLRSVTEALSAAC